MSKIFEYECACGSAGFVGELGMLEPDWWVCPECGRDIRDYEVVDDDYDDDVAGQGGERSEP